MKKANKSIQSRLVAGSTWSLLGKFVHVISMLASTAILARSLTPSDFGTFVLSFSIVSFLAIFALGGTNMTIVPLVARATAQESSDEIVLAVRNTLVWLLLGTVLVCSAAVVLLPSIAIHLFHNESLARCASKLIFWTIWYSATQYFCETLRGLDELRGYSLLNGPFFYFGFAIVLELGRLAGVLSLGYSLDSAISIAAGNMLIAALCVWRTAKLNLSNLFLQRPPLDERFRLGRVGCQSIPLMVTSCLSQISGQMDIWLLGLFSTRGSVALYGAVVRWALLIALPMRIVNSIIPSFIAELRAKGRYVELENLLRTAATVVTIPAGVFMLVVLPTSHWLLKSLYGEFYSDGTAVLILLSFGQLVSVFLGATVEMLIMADRGRMTMNINIATGVFAATTGAYAAHRWGAVGVAAVFGSTQAIRETLLWLDVRVGVGIWTHANLSPNFILLVAQWLRIKPAKGDTVVDEIDMLQSSTYGERAR